MNMNANMNMRPAQPQASTPQYPVSRYVSNIAFWLYHL